MSSHLAVRPALRYLDAGTREKASERLRLAATVSVIVALHLLGIALLALGSLGGSGAVAIGAALTAYLAGLRHAADCDHITGIDNATRKFVGEGRRPTSVGLAFSLGHSTVVLLLAIAIAVGSGLARGVATDGAPSALGSVGGLVAGGFLLLIGAFNAVSLHSLLRSGSHVETPVPTFAGRLMAAPLARVRQPRHIFVVGFLFGLGFDTATLIGLLVLTAATATSGIGIVGVLALPVSFAAGMTLADTVNGLLMMRMYSSATMSKDDRRGFNILVTSMSVISALLIGTIVLAETMRSGFGFTDPVTAAFARVDLEYAGFALIALFALAWIDFALRRRTRSA